MYIAMLGRQPELGLAELESVYGNDVISYTPGTSFAQINATVSPGDLDRLGGTVKLAHVITTLNTTNWHDIARLITRNINEYIAPHTSGKLHLGFSVYGLRAQPRDVNNMALSAKKTLKRSAISIRIVPNKTLNLGSAQVVHNHLAGTNGREILLIKHKHQTILARTIAEQDIESYTARDQARPARDAFVGMLPPKLAQILINLTGLHPSSDKRILDPFCGTGVILQESLLMGFSTYGTDLNDKMIDYSRKNLDWLADSFELTAPNWTVEQGDAMSYKWSQPIDAVACEGYLGQPFSAPPSPAKLKQVRDNCQHIMGDFLKNLSVQIQTGTPVVIAVPAWRDTSGRFTHLPLTNNVSDYGFRQVTPQSTPHGRLLYFRENQVVAREILILVKK